MTKFPGYVPEEKLPFQKMQSIIIPRGTRVTSTGSKGTYVTKRMVTTYVDHFKPGKTWTPITFDSYGNYRWSVGDGDLERLADILGLPYATNDDRREVEKKVLDLASKNRSEPKGCSVGMIHTSNTKVVWIGSDKYWCEADINDLL